MKPLRFSQSARKHRIGRAHVYYVIATGTATPTIDPDTGTGGVVFTGTDDRGAHLTIVIIEKADCFLVIHAQPAYRRRKP